MGSNFDSCGRFWEHLSRKWKIKVLGWVAPADCNPGRMKLLSPLLFSFALLTSAASAAISFSGGGTSITVSVTDLPAFTISTVGSSYQFTLMFENVYSSPVTVEAGGYSTSPILTSINGGANLSSVFNIASSGESGIQRSFIVMIQPERPGGFAIGDVVKIQDFTVTFDNANFSPGLYQLPNDVNSGSVFLADGWDRISNVAAIPEPSAALLGAFGTLALLRRRR